MLRMECGITVAVFWNITTCGLVGTYCHSGATNCLLLLNMRGSRFLQNDDLYHTTGCNIPEHSIVHSHQCQNQISYTFTFRVRQKHLMVLQQNNILRQSGKNFINISRYIPCPLEFI